MGGDREIDLGTGEAALIGAGDLINVFVSFGSEVGANDGFLVHQQLETTAGEFLHRSLGAGLPQQNKGRDKGNDQEWQETFKLIRHFRVRLCS